MPYRTWSQGSDSYQNSSCELNEKETFCTNMRSGGVQKVSFLTKVQEDLGGGGEISGICKLCDQRDGGILFDLFKNLSIFFLKTEYAGIKGGCG